MRGTTVKIKLDHINPEMQTSQKLEKCRIQTENVQREGRNTRERTLLFGNYFLAKQPKKKKYSPPYKPVSYSLFKIQDSQIRPDEPR